MEIRNQYLYEYYKSHGKKKAIELVCEKCQNCSVPPTQKAFELSVKKVIEKTEQLKKNKHRPKQMEEFSHFMKSAYVFPCGESNKRGLRVSTDETLDLKQSLVDEKIKNQSIIEKLCVAENEKQEKVEALNAKGYQVEKLKLNLKRTGARENYMKIKSQKLEEKVNEKCCETKGNQIKELHIRLQEKDREIGILNENIEYLNQIVQDIDNEHRVINIFDEESKRYTSKFKTCVYELLKLNVSASKVGDVVQSVMKLVSVEPNKLPSKATVLNMNLQRLCLSQRQLADVFSNEENTCLLTDETSKFGSKYMGYEAADSTGQLWVLGLREIETKSSEDTLKVFKEILSDLDNAKENSNVSRDIVTHISATMSDRAATEMKFNRLLETYRKDILPLTYHNYETFSEEEKSALESMNNFFCGLHALVNYAETCQKCILEVEKEIFDDNPPICDTSYKTNNEPGSCRLIRTAAKAFGDGSGGDEKSGCQGQFKTFVSDFLSENNLKSVPLKSYRGSRFNILFSNACSVFFLHEQIVTFLETVGAENRLLKAVLHDIKVPEYIAAVKALGLISKFITGPLWSILEDKNISILDMNSKYLQLVNYFDDAVQNIDQFMTGQLIYDERVVRDNFLQCLLEPRPYDQIVQTYLAVVLSALGKLARRLYKDHLPSGILTTTPIKAMAAPKTSCFAESVFGQMDQMMRTKPNLSVLAAEASIMFANNKTMEWLAEKDSKERDITIKKASRQVPSMRRKFKERISSIEEQRKIKMQEKIRKREESQREKIRKQETHTRDILFHGLWQSQAEIDQMLLTYDTKSDKTAALKAQLKFRKQVLLQVPENKTNFNLTKCVQGKKSRKNLSVEELTENLKSLVQQAIVKDIENDEQRHMLIGKRIKHRFTVKEDGKDVQNWFTGRVISQVPWFREWFNVVYDGDEAVYTLKHLPTDLENEDLKILV